MAAVRSIHLLQQTVQGAWSHDDPVLAQIPHLNPFLLQTLGFASIPLHYLRIPMFRLLRHSFNIYSLYVLDMSSTEKAVNHFPN